MSSLPAYRITDLFAVVPDQLSNTAVPNNKSAPTEHTNVNSIHSTASKGERVMHSSPSGLKQKGTAAFGPDAKIPNDGKDRVGFISNL
eukprot:13706721-Ditylum_brightwellii.AAC.1